MLPTTPPQQICTCKQAEQGQKASRMLCRPLTPAGVAPGDPCRQRCAQDSKQGVPLWGAAT